MPNEETVAYLGGRILTMDRAGRVASGLVARGGRIVAVGDAKELRASLSPGTEEVDLAGRVVLPGFVDGHCHLELTVTDLAYAVQCFAPPHRTLAELGRAMTERARRIPAGEWVVGRANFSLERWVEDQRPLTRQDLDAAVPDHPAVVFSGLHVCALNTRALQVTGLLNGPPPRGATLDVGSGRATELWAWLPLPRHGVEEIARAVRDLGRSMFLGRGVTSIAEIPFTPDGIRAYQALRRSGDLPVRLGLWYHVPRLCSVEELTRTGLEAGFGDDWLRLGGIKLFVDGAGFDIWGHELSDLQWDQGALDETVWDAHRGGLQIWMHVAPTRTAADMALTALERATARQPRPDLRHRIEHLGDMRPEHDLLARARALGVTPVATPQFVYSYGDTDPNGSCCPLRTLHELGFRVPGNSDCTGTQPEAANPFHGIWCAMAHETREGSVVAGEETIGLDAAIRTFTSDAAHACRMDDRGSLEPGKLADMVVLGRDPWETNLDELPEIPVDATVVGGKVAWER